MGKLLHLSEGELQTVFWEIWAQEQGYLYSLCLKWMGNSTDAEDALSSAMIKAWEKLPQHYTEINNLKSWLSKVTYNHCMDLHRLAARRPGSHENIDEVLGREREGAGMAESPEDMIMRREMYSNLHRVIQTLPEALQQPMALRCFEDLPYRQIARELKLTPENARKRVQKARKMISEKMDQPEQRASGPEILQIPENTTLRAVSGPSREIPPFPPQPWRILVKQNGKATCEAFIFLHDKPRRLEQKKSTLINYVAGHPGGWIKRLELGELCLAMGDWEEAWEEFSYVLQKRPDQHGIRAKLIYLALHLQKDKAGAELAREGLDQVSEKSAKAFLSGCAHLLEGSPEVALELFRECMAADPYHPQLAFWIPVALERIAGGFPLLNFLEKQFENNPKNLFILLQYAKTLTECGRHEVARAVLHFGLTHFPDSAPLQIKIALHEGLEVGDQFRKQLNRLPENSEIAYLKAGLQARAGKSTSGLKILEKFIAHHPELQAARLNLIQHILRHGPLSQLPKALKNHLPHFHGREEISSLCLILPEIDLDGNLARQIFRKLDDLGFSNWKISLAKGYAAQQAGQPAEIWEKFLDQALSEQKELPLCFLKAAEIFLKAGNYMRAIALARKSLNILPPDARGLAARGHLCLAASLEKLSAGEMLQHLQKVHLHSQQMASPVPGLGLFYRGEAAFLAGDYGIAAEFYYMALDLGLPFPWKSRALAGTEFRPASKQEE
ncbi:MAG: sigma-70 family RNA polymerase sigma factor [Bacteroidia bacterium]|nr:sigma-70 family RNA polymerase sigma factor [Bacteroidia bacterium]